MKLLHVAKYLSTIEGMRLRKRWGKMGLVRDSNSPEEKAGP